MTKQEIKPSVINQLRAMSKTLENLEYYEYDVCGDNYTDAIVYSELRDQVDDQILEILNRKYD